MRKETIRGGGWSSPMLILPGEAPFVSNEIPMVGTPCLEQKVDAPACKARPSLRRPKYVLINRQKPPNNEEDDTRYRCEILPTMRSGEVAICLCSAQSEIASIYRLFPHSPLCPMYVFILPPHHQSHNGIKRMQNRGTWTKGQTQEKENSRRMGGRGDSWTFTCKAQLT